MLDKEQKILVVNQQKTRVDVLLDFINNPSLRPIPTKVFPHLQRTDIYDMILQQANVPWLLYKKNNCSYVVIDSFAELTDQKFVHRSNHWHFCSHYSDINPTPEFDKQFSCEGLLEMDKIEPAYLLFLNWFEQQYPNTHLIYLHFPTALDSREKYKERGSKISEVMKKIAQEKSYIHNIEISEEYVYPHPDDNFPYHFAKGTYEKFYFELEKLPFFN